MTPIQIYLVDIESDSGSRIVVTDILFQCQEDGLHIITVSFNRSFTGSITCNILYI